jgi:hypothetical protein
MKLPDKEFLKSPATVALGGAGAMILALQVMLLGWVLDFASDFLLIGLAFYLGRKSKK